MTTTAMAQSGLRKRPTSKWMEGALENGASFKRDERGNVAMIFGLSLGALCLMIGGAVDMGRWLNARDQTFEAMDSAVLAAGRALQAGKTNAEAIALAQKMYAANTKNRIKVWKDTVTFTVKSDRTKVYTNGNVLIRTPFLQFVNISTMPLYNEVKEAPIATTAQTRVPYNREVSLMLDVSGSMCSPCSKRDTMKTAAKNLVDTMTQYNSVSAYKTRIALIPFSGDVRPPTTWTSTVTAPGLLASIVKSLLSFGTTYKYTYYKSKCVGERTGTNKYTKAAPGTSNYVLAAYDDSNSSQGYCQISTSSTVVPLSDNATTLKTAIDALATGGNTAGHVGTAWAYYMLSPTWNSVIPAASQPQAYGADKLRKIAVLMTDGEYNMERDVDGIPVGDSGAGTSANGKTSAQQAVSICQNMKTDGIEVFTIGFDLGGNQTAISTLSTCATDASHFYNAADNSALLAAFNDIGIKLTDLHLER